MVAGIGPGLAADLGYATEFATDDKKPASVDRISFGARTALVDMMQEMPAAKLQVNLVKQLSDGSTNLKELIAAASLANAETFGGEDYVGYHAEMALIPALRISEELSSARAALPVLKVLYRNTQRIQGVGGKKKKTLRPVDKVEQKPADDIDQRILTASRSRDVDQAERLFATTAGLSPEKQLAAILPIVEDDINVHRFVLAHRSLELIDIVGVEHSQTMLRQCVRYCVDEERMRAAKGRSPSPIRKFLPKMLSTYKLDNRKSFGTRDPGDKWVGETCEQLYQSNRFEAAELVAAALADGISPNVIGEMLSLAANMFVLRQGNDPWRTHGASHGVHGSDAVNSWRNIVRVAPPLHQAAGLIVAAFHTGQYQPFKGEPYPTEAHREKVNATEGAELLGIAEEAIRANDQPMAAAAIHVYGEQGYSPKPVFSLMRKYAISEDGRLHAEKYYRTVVEEFASIRPAFRWRELVGLARVTASCYGYNGEDKKGFKAAGYEDACKLLGVEA